MPRHAPAHERFWNRVDRRSDDECWVWLGVTTGWSGYGRFSDQGRKVLAHRWVYEDANGPIPDGLVIDHLCRTRLCVNPAHLEAVTPRTNAIRGVGITAQKAARTTCPQGHPYNGVDARGGRICTICAHEAKLRYRARLAAQRAS